LRNQAVLHHHQVIGLPEEQNCRISGIYLNKNKRKYNYERKSITGVTVVPLQGERRYLTTHKKGFMMENQFIGTWKLVSFEFRDSNDNVTYPFGKDAIGVITYDQVGYMSVQLMIVDRPRFLSDDPQRGTPDEIKAAFEGFISYFGTFTVSESDRTVTHHLDGSSFPNWVGGDQKRFYKFSGNRLTLSTPPIPVNGVSMTGHLIWERMRKV
jgi:hypothetical protein